MIRIGENLYPSTKMDWSEIRELGFTINDAYLAYNEYDKKVIAFLRYDLPKSNWDKVPSVWIHTEETLEDISKNKE